MTLRTLVCAGLTAAVLLAGPRAQAQATGGVTIGQTDSIWSPTLKEWRRYQVYLPSGYRLSAFAPRAYPVVYLLDGNIHFHSFTGALQFLSAGLNGNNVVPEMIVVAIPNTNRMRDLSPIHVTTGYDGKPAPEMATTGGGDAFLQFVQRELIPKIDSTYRVEPYRVLVGHSLGGIMAIRALFTMPETFNAYIAIDPSLWWANRSLVREAASRLTQPGVEGRAVYVAAANTVDLHAPDSAGPCAAKPTSAFCRDTIRTSHFRAIREFDEIVRRSRAPIRYRFRYYPNEDHGSVPLLAEYDGLRFIFDAYRMVLPEKPTVADVRAHFARVSASQGYTVLPPERVLFALRGVMSDSASSLALARYAAECYPVSASAQEGLATALLKARDTVGAVQAYERALRGNPDNARLKVMLEQLRRP